MRSEHTGAFVRLSQLWQRRSHYSLVFATVDEPAYRDALIARLDADRAAARINLRADDEAGGQPETTPADWLQALQRARAAGHDRVHVCLPLDARRSDAWWQQANLLRERLADAFAGVQLLWLTEAEVDAAAHQAPDLWNWRETVVSFTSTLASAPGTIPEPSGQRFDYYSDQTAAAVTDRLAQIDAYLAHHDDRGVSDAHLLLEASRAHERLGHSEQSLQSARLAAELFDREGDATHAAQALAQAADLSFQLGHPDDALKVLTEQVLPVYERLGDVREKAVTMGQVADILRARGQLDEALRIRREEVLPVFERLGDVREKAVCQFEIAQGRALQGHLSQARALLTDEVLPAFEALGMAREVQGTREAIAALGESSETPQP